MEIKSKHAREKEKSQKIKIFNLVITPVANQSPERYVELLQCIYDQKIEVNTWSERYTRIKTLYGVGTSIIHGEFVNYTRLDPNMPALNTETNELEKLNIDPTYGPNAKSAAFYFVPRVHKLVLHFPMKFSDSHVFTFLTKAFPQVAAEGESVNVNVAIDKEAINRIIDAEAVRRLRIVLSYANNDNQAGWAQVMNEQLQQSHVMEVETIYKAENRQSIVIAEDGLIRGQLDLSENHGYAEATITENGAGATVKTLDHPKIESVNYVDEIIPQVERRMVELFGADEAN